MFLDEKKLYRQKQVDTNVFTGVILASVRTLDRLHIIYMVIYIQIRYYNIRFWVNQQWIYFCVYIWVFFTILKSIFITYISYTFFKIGDT